MIESLKEHREFVKYAEIPQNSGSGIFRVIWKNGQNAGMPSNLGAGKVPYDESILNCSLPCQCTRVCFSAALPSLQVTEGLWK